MLDIQIPDDIELETSEDDDIDVEQTWLGEIRELEKGEEYIEDKQEEDDSSHRQSSVVTTLAKLSKVKLILKI